MSNLNEILFPFFLKLFHSYFRVILICHIKVLKAQVLKCRGEMVPADSEEACKPSRRVWSHRICKRFRIKGPRIKRVNSRRPLLPSLRATGRLPIWAETCRRLFLGQGCLEVTSKAWVSMSAETARMCFPPRTIFSRSMLGFQQEQKNN